MNILCLDIGGTNPRMAMVDSDTFKIISDISGMDKAIVDISLQINDFLHLCAQKNMITEVCSISVAGPTFENKRATPTNSKFIIDADDVISKTNLKKVVVYNDFVAIAHGVLTLGKDSYEKIKDGRPEENGSFGIIGPGTGLGVGYLHWDRKLREYIVSSSETGHASMATPRGYDVIFNFVRDKLNINQIANETMVSGPGIERIAEYFLLNPKEYDRFIRDSNRFKEYIEETKTNEELLQALRDDRDGNGVDFARTIAESSSSNKIARLSMRIFMDLLGEVASDVALNGMTKGGVYLAGGILPKNMDVLKLGDFNRIFVDNWKPHISKLLHDVPVYLITDYNISFYGCARGAIQYFNL